MEQAAKFAESTQILMNVSEFTDVSRATDTLISSVQAFGYTADTSMEVVDLLNTIGNNYAISTADLAQSLTKSSASLVAAGGDLAEAAALTATANAIIQDADAVGTALKTTSLRLRGTDTKVLEEEGVDSEGAVTSKSKLQSKVKALSGVDILTESGDYKSTYQILSQIADVWEDINNMDQAALLELLAGKRNASVLAAILQAPEELKAAYEDAQDAEGSALQENEKYMDSIQGKIDQFNNALQTMWKNLLDDDVVKFFVDLGKQLVVLLDKIGPLNALFIGFGVFAAKKYNLLDSLFGKPDSIEKSIEKLQQQRAKLDGLTGTKAANQRDAIDLQIKEKQAILDQKRAAAANAAAAAEAKDAAATRAGTVADSEAVGATTAKTAATWADVWAEMTREGATWGSVAATIQQVLATKLLNTAYVQNLIATGQLTAAEVANMSITKLLGLGFKGLAVGIGEATASMLTFLFTTPVGWFILAAGAVVGLGVAFSKMHVSADEASEKLKETKEAVAGLETELDGLKSELEEAKEKLAELLALPHLSITQQEEVDRLERTIELLEREIALRERELALKEQQTIADAEETMKKKFSNEGQNYYQVGSDGIIKQDTAYGGIGKSGDQAVEAAIEHYKEREKDLEIAYDLLSDFDDSSGVPVKSIKGASPHFKKKIDGLITSKEELIDEIIKPLEAEKNAIEQSINDFFGDASYQFTYGMSDELDEYRRQLDNLQLKWDKTLYGDASKVDAFESMFGAGATEEMQNLKKDIDEIMTAEGNWADDDEKWKAKNDAIQTLINSIDSTKDGYEQLDWTLKEFGATVQDIADYFTIANGAFDSDTISGIAKQYAKGIEIMKRFQAMSDPKARDNYVKENVLDKKPNADQPKTNKSDEETRKAEDKSFAKAEEKKQKEDRDKAEKEAKAKEKAEKENAKKEEKARKEQAKAEEKARKEKERAEAEAAERVRKEAEEARKKEEKARQEAEKAKIEAEEKTKKEAEEEARRQAEAEEKTRKEQEKAKKQAEKEAKAKEKAEKERIEKAEKDKVKAEAKVLKEQEKQSKVQVDVAKEVTSKVELDAKKILSDTAKIGVGVAGATALLVNPIDMSAPLAGVASKAAMELAKKKTAEDTEAKTKVANPWTIPTLATDKEIKDAMESADKKVVEGVASATEDAAEEIVGVTEESLKDISKQWKLSSGTRYEDVERPDYIGRMQDQANEYLNLVGKTFGGTLEDGSVACLNFARTLAQDMLYKATGDMDAFSTKYLQVDPEYDLGAKTLGSEMWAEWGEALGLEGGLPLVQNKRGDKINDYYLQPGTLFTWAEASGESWTAKDIDEKRYDTNYLGHAGVITDTEYSEELGELMVTYADDLHNQVITVTQTEFENMGKISHAFTQEMVLANKSDMHGIPFTSSKIRDAIVSVPKGLKDALGDIKSSEDYIPNLEDRKGDSFIDKFTGTERGHDVEHFFKRQFTVGRDDKRTQAVDFFKDKGLSDKITAAIVGNFEHESNWDTDLFTNTGEIYGGIAQWRGDRLQALIDQYGENATFEDQLEFAWSELQNNYADVLTSMTDDKSLDELTKIFETGFEKPNADLAMTSNRQKIAENIFNEFTKQDDEDGIWDDITDFLFPTAEAAELSDEDIRVMQESAQQMVKEAETIAQDEVAKAEPKFELVGPMPVVEPLGNEDVSAVQENVKNQINEVETVVDAELLNWYDSADEFTKNIVYGIGIQVDTSDWDLDQWKEEVEKVINDESEYINISWDELFTVDADGNFKAEADKFGAILKGMDNDTRKTFISIVESVKNGKKSWEQGMAEFSLDGLHRSFDLVNEEFEDLNNQVFSDIADEINGLIDTAGELTAALDSVVGSMELVRKAQEQMSNSGRVSVKTALEIMQTTEDWDKVLNITEDSITLLDGAENVLIQSQLDHIKVQTAEAVKFADAQYEAALLAAGMTELEHEEQMLNSTQSDVNQTINSGTQQMVGYEVATDNAVDAEYEHANSKVEVMTADAAKSKAIGILAAHLNLVADAVAAVMGKMEWSQVGSNYTQTLANVYANANAAMSSLDTYRRTRDKRRDINDAMQQVDSVEGLRDYYDYDKTPGDKYDKDGGDGESAFEQMQARHEREIAALEHQQELIQGDIDILEAQRKGVSSDYYKKLIAGENSKIDAYERQLAEAKNLLAATSTTSEEYNEIVEHIWDIEKGLQDAALAAIEFGEALNANHLKGITDLGDAYSNFYDIIDRQTGSMDLYKEGVEIGGGQVNERWYDDMIAKAKEERSLADQELTETLAAINDYRAQKNPFKQGTAEYEGFEYDRNVNLVELHKQAADAKNRMQEADNEALQLAEDKKDAYIEAWENVATGFERIGTLFENQISLIDGYESRLEALNINVPDSVYDKKAKTQQNIIDNLDEEIAYDQQMLEEYATKYGTDDERYLSKREELDGKLVERYEAQTQLIEIEQQIIDNQIDRFNQTIDRMNDAVDKMNNIKGLVSDEDVANEDGSWTAEGLTQAGMNFQEMAYQKEVVTAYADEMEELTELYEEGKISEKEYYEQMKELEDGQWSAIEAYKAAEDAIVDLEEARIDALENGLQEEIDSYKELIDLKKEELDAERDLFEFRRDVEDQSKNIAEIERRMASISNSSSDEDRAEYKRLEKELYEANRGLDDTYRNHSYDQTSQALDEELEMFEKTYEDYIQGLRDELENTDELIKRIYGDVVTNGQLVLETLVQLSDEHGFTLDENLVSPWRNANGESLNFEIAATEHYNNIKNTVELGTAGFVENIEKPWRRGQEESKLFAQDAENYLQSALDSAIAKKDDMTNAIAAPWLNMKELIDQGPTWVSTAADEILKRVRKNVEEINAAYAEITNVGAQLSENVTSGGGGNETPTSTYNPGSYVQPEPKPKTTKKPHLANYTNKEVLALGFGPLSASGVNAKITSGAITASQAAINAINTAIAIEPYLKKIIKFSGASASGMKANSSGDNGVVTWSGQQYEVQNASTSAMSSNLGKAVKHLGYSSGQVFGYSGGIYAYLDNAIQKLEGRFWSKKGYNNLVSYAKSKYSYAKGTTGTSKDHFAITDEPQYGDELVLVPSAAGNLSFMRKGTGVVPADLTKRIMEIAQMPAGELGNNIVKAFVPNIETNTQSVQVNFEALVKADNITNDVLPEVEKLVEKQLNTFTKNLNYSLKKVGGR